MAASKQSKSAAVRARLNHPVIDGDGHWLEPIPIFLDFLKDVAGPSTVDKWIKKAKDTTWYDITPAERIKRRLHRPTWRLPGDDFVHGNWKDDIGHNADLQGVLCRAIDRPCPAKGL